MKYNKVGYMFRPTEAQWDQILRTTPKENWSKALFDLVYGPGVMSGLEIQQQAAPNLTVKIKKGRAVYLDTTAKTAKVIELLADANLDLSAEVPVGSPTEIPITISTNLISSTTITPPNAPVGEEDYDAAYTPTAFDFVEQDSSTLHIGNPGGGITEYITLGSVILSAGQTQILTSHIKDTARQIASPNPKVLELQARIDDMKTRICPIGSILDWAGDASQVPVGWALCNGATLHRLLYPTLFQLLGITFGSGDGINTFALPDLRNKFVVGAGDEYTRNASGGLKEITLNEAKIPSHTHGATIASGGSHDHPASSAAAGDHTHTPTMDPAGEHQHFLTGGDGGGGSGTYAPIMQEIASHKRFAGTGPADVGAGDTPISSNWDTLTVPAGSSRQFIEPRGEHTHPLSLGTTGSHSHGITVQANGAHTHGITIDSVGGGEAHENRPPYIGLFKIIRID